MIDIVLGDVFLESVRAAVLLVILLYLFHAGRRADITQRGWRLLTLGFALLWLGSLLDITDNFESLNRYGVIGDTPTEAVLEKLVCFLGGFVLIAIALVRWLPTLTSVQRLRQLNEELDQQADQLTRSNAELTKARQAADAASRAKGDFLANMSHEIRTPLNGVLGMTQLALDTELNATQRDYLQTAQESGEALLCLINDILDFSKIEAGKLELRLLPFALRERLGDTLRPFTAHAQAKGVELAFRVDPEVPEHLIGDFGRLRQVVINLVDNAVKFTERGEVVLNVERESGRGDAPTLHFFVVDSGIGITPDKLGLIFEEFEQIDSSSTRNYGGTGLGLAISSRLVSLMNGRIWVESEVDQGTTFHFTARFEPATKSDAVEPDLGHTSRTSRREDTTSAPTLPARSLRVLLAEDNPVNQRLIVALLRRRGHEVVAVNNGADAVARLAAAPFDLALMDIQMPEMDGLTAAKRIREDERVTGDHLPIIAMTARAMIGDREECLAAGMDDYLAKPVDVNELYDTVDALAKGPARTDTELGPRS